MAATAYESAAQLHTAGQAVSGVCPYPYCNGQIEAGTCTACGRDALACTACSSARRWNRSDAARCRSCAAPLARMPAPGWPMPGGTATRNCHVPEIGIRKVQAAVGGGMRPLPEFGIEGQVYGQVPQPIIASGGVVVPHVAQGGFALLTCSPAAAPAWISELGFPLGVESSPVELGASFYCAVSDGPCMHLARVQLDTGLPDFIGSVRGALSPGQPPLGWVEDGQGIAVWPLGDALLVLRLSEAMGRLTPGRGRQPVLLHAHGLLPDEFLLAPVLWGDQLVAVSNRGTILRAAWGGSAEALRAHGLAKLRRGEGTLRCGAPMVLHGRLVWLQARRGAASAAGDALSLMIMDRDGQAHEVPLHHESTPELERSTGTWLTRPLIYDGGARIVVFGGMAAVAYAVSIARNAPIDLRVHPLSARVAALGAAASTHVFALLEENRLVVARSLRQWWTRGDDAPVPVSVPFAQGARSFRPLAAPVIGRNGVYVLTTGGLLCLPAVE